MIKLAKQEDQAELYLYGAIGDEWDGFTSKDVAAAVKEAGAVERLVVRINSEGGSAFEGIAIYNQLMRAPALVEVSIDGIAASAASIVAMAGDEIKMGSAAFMMIHDPWGIVMGNAADMRQTADVLESIAGQVAEVYAFRANGDSGEFRKLMAAETWLTAEEAAALNLADEVEQREMVAAKWDLSRFKNAPQGLGSQPKQKPKEPERPVMPRLREYQSRRALLAKSRSGV